VKSVTLDKLVDQDFVKISKRIERFISSYISKSLSKGLVIGLSGGLDSSVVLKLAVNALGPSKILGLVLPSEVTPKEDVDHALELASSLGIKHQVIDISALLKKYSEALPENKRARGNLTARIRMNILYYYAGVNNYLVAGTSDKSELCIGYFTKYGDGAADILPIADLYKTQVRALARFLEIPTAIIEKKSSPRLWDNHLAEEEIGMGYETIDPILHLLIDRKIKPRGVAKKLAIPLTNVNKVRDMVDSSMHKRRLPATALLKS
jgi:NAD+ synthase